MDIRDYEYIVTIAEQGSITRAAAQLFITQPALTKFLQRIESSLGLKLFVRSGNQLLLTEAGRRYVETGRKIVQMDRELSEHLRQELTARKSRIRLGFSMGRTQDILDNVLPDFYKRYPKVQISTFGDTSRRQMNALQKDDLDFVMVTNVEQLPGYTYLPVDKSYLALAVQEDSPLISQSQELSGYPFPVVSKDVLTDLPFVALTPTTNSGHIFREMCRKYDIQPHVILEVNNVQNIIDAVECGYGAAMFMSIPLGSRKVRYLSVREVEVTLQTTNLVYRTDKALTPAMKYLIGLLSA